jgi:hypothetical protein
MDSAPGDNSYHPEELTSAIVDHEMPTGIGLFVRMTKPPATFE